MRLRVWAPAGQTVHAVLVGGPRPMAPAGGGWWALDAPELGPGDDYAFAVDGSPPLPDPRSRWQPNGVHGASRVFDPAALRWTDEHWRGRALPGSVVYELHVGTFTPEGTFDAAAARLDHLVDLGVDLVELLPVNAFDGPAGWGYDGVGWYAVHEPYGGPAGLARFVDAAHRSGIGVVLDVVYNHLGPSGAYLNRFGPYFTDRHHTPWGPAVNLDGPGSDEVRRYLVDNALGWLADFHLDGLRLDAVHELVDTRAVHVLEELAAAVHALGARLGKPLFAVAETDRNDPRTVLPVAAGGLGLDAQWSDDFHHALHALLTGERQGYYADFGDLDTLAKALTGVFVHDGGYSSFRGRRHGRPVPREQLGGHRFLGYLQDHDQVGNRALGERIGALTTAGRARIGAVLVLTAPFTPMLFMGEEWGAGTPWRFFASFPDPQLADAVRRGRRAEFAAHGWSAEQVPDPMDPATRDASVLDWSEPQRAGHAETLAFYRALIALRRRTPDLMDDRLDRVRCAYDAAAGWFVVYRGAATAVAVNLAAHEAAVPLAGPPVELLLTSGPGVRLAAGAVHLPAETVAVVSSAGAAGIRTPPLAPR